MKIRKKTIYIVSLTIFSLLIILSTSFELILKNRIDHLEKEATERNVNRVIDAINLSMSHFSVKVIDWAKWDDTYRFIKDLNSEYINSNLNCEALADLNINMMLFFDNNSELVYGKEYIDSSSCTDVISPEIINSIKSHKQLFIHDSIFEFKTGIIQICNKIIIFGSGPILLSTGTGPAAGTILFAKYFTYEDIEKLSQITHLSIESSLLSDIHNPDMKQAMEKLLKSEPIYIKPLNEKTIAGYSLIYDVDNKPSAIFCIKTDRTIYLHGKLISFYMLFTILLSSVSLGIILNLTLEKIVTSRITYLSREVNYITDKKNSSLRVNIKGNDELADLSSAINCMLQKIETSESELLNQNQHMKLIMDTLPSGLLSLNENLIINSEYSKSIESILSIYDLSGKSFPDLLYPNSLDNREKLIEFLEILRQNTTFPENELADFNPFPVISIESQTVQRWIKIKYHKINRGFGLTNHILVVMEDITSQRLLEKKIKESEQENLQLKIIAEDPDLFRYFLSDIKQLINDSLSILKNICNTDNKNELLHKIYRDIHTIKGTASSFGMTSISECAQSIENCFHDHKDNPDIQIMKCATNSIQNLSNIIDIEIEKMRSIIGDSIEENNGMVLRIPFSKFDQLYIETQNLIYNKLTDINDVRWLLSILKNNYIEFRTVPAKRGFTKALKVAQDLKKLFATDIDFSFRGEDVLIDCILADQLNTPAIHLLRNAFAHGIESFEERFVSGKDSKAHIIFSIETNEHTILLTVSDDGRGIDPEKIVQVAIKKGFMTEKEALSLNKEQKINLILIEGFTTSESDNQISGRGIGMSAVHDFVVNKIGGSLEIQSEINIGTKFIIKIPDKNKLWSFT